MTSVECPQTYKEGDTQSIYQQLLVFDTYVYSLIHHSDHCETRIMKTKLLAVLSLLLTAGQLTGKENKKIYRNNIIYTCDFDYYKLYTHTGTHVCKNH